MCVSVVATLFPASPVASLPAAAKDEDMLFSGSPAGGFSAPHS